MSAALAGGFLTSGPPGKSLGSISIRLSYIQEKAMAPHSSVLAWRIPGTGEPGGLLSMGTRLK